MKTILNYILSPIFYFVFGLSLVLFHPFQILIYNVFGKNAQQKSIFFLNRCLVNSLRLLGTRIKVNINKNLPVDRPKIFLANHSSLHDIPGLYAYLGKYNPIFVSKMSLAKGIPSVSYNLVKSGAALIDRSDRKQAIEEIIRLGNLIHETNRSAVLFPEGTRRPGLQMFKEGGLNALLKKAPNALVVPIVIRGTADLYVNRKAFPLNTFQKISWKMLDPIEPGDKTSRQILDESYNQIKNALEA